MKPQETKFEFIRLRAAGFSQAATCKRLGICKATAQAWEREFSEDIAETKAADLESVYEEFRLKRKGRVERLGKTLERIDAALEACDLSTVAPDRLLKMKLEYMQTLKTECVATSEALPEFQADNIQEGLRQMLASLLQKVAEGEASEAQVTTEAAALASALKATESLDVSERLEGLENALGIRRAG